MGKSEVKIIEETKLFSVTVKGKTKEEVDKKWKGLCSFSDIEMKEIHRDIGGGFKLGRV